jgi:hypothetical protein
MINEKKGPLEEKKALLKESFQLKRKLNLLTKQLSETVFPFDYTGNEPSNDTFREFVEAMIQKGYLTPDIKPTEYSLKKDYIRYNDGSIQFEGIDQQPELVITAAGLLHIGKRLNKEFFNQNKN